MLDVLFQPSALPWLPGTGFFAFKNAFEVAFPMQDTGDVERVVLQKVVDPDCFEPGDRPGAQIPQLRVA